MKQKYAKKIVKYFDSIVGSMVIKDCKKGDPVKATDINLDRD